MKNIIALLALTIICSTKFMAQQTPALEHYLVNPYFYNPASAGLEGTNLFLDYHKQWADFSGAPETQVLTFDKSFKKDKFGFGFKLINDEINILGSTSGYFTYAYQIKIGEIQSLRFGVEAGFRQNRVLFDKVVASDNDEALIFRTGQNATNVDGSAGLIYKLQNFTLGLSAQNLIPNSFHYQNSETSNELIYRNIQHYYLNAMYDIKLGDSKWGLQPSVFVKGAKGLPFVFDGNLTTTYNELLWLTLRYKHAVGYSVGAGGVISDQIKIGYAYSLSSNDLVGYNNGTHEVILGIALGNNKSGSGSNLSNRQLDKIESQNNELLEKTDYLEKQTQTLKEELERQKEELKNKVYGLDELKLEIMKEMETWKSEHLNDTVNTSGFNAENNAASSELESETLSEDGDKYVVIGATRELSTAKKYQSIIVREYNMTTRILQNSRKTWYLIYTLKTDSAEDAEEELIRVKKMDKRNIYVGKPWVYEIKK
jgi:type IX secretion system PorP/SprF family membrane protein